MSGGEILTQGRPDEIKQQYPYPLYRLEGEGLPEIRSYFKNLPTVQNTQLFGNAVHVSFLNKPTRRDWKNWQRDTSDRLQKWQPQEPSMEDIFMYFIGEGTSIE